MPIRAPLLAFAIVFTVGAAHAQEISADEQALLERLVVAEAGGEGRLGMALVARSVLNRVSLLRSRSLSTGTYLARGRSISGVINGRYQYEPVSSGSIRRRRSAAQLQEARAAIALARDTSALRAALRARGVSAARINNLIRATGFRARSAFSDRSQHYDRTTFRNHVFNTDRFSRELDVPELFERYYERASVSATAARGARGSSGRGSRTRRASRGMAGALGETGS